MIPKRGVKNVVKSAKNRKARLEKQLNAENIQIKSREQVLNDLVDITHSKHEKFRRNFKTFKEACFLSKHEIEERKKKYEGDKKLCLMLEHYPKMCEDSKLLNGINNQLDKEIQINKLFERKVVSFKNGLDEFMESVLTEVNEVTAEQVKQQGVKSTVPPDKKKTNREKEKDKRKPPSSNITGMSFFGLHDNDRTEDLERRFNKKYKRG